MKAIIFSFLALFCVIGVGLFFRISEQREQAKIDEAQNTVVISDVTATTTIDLSETAATP